MKTLALSLAIALTSAFATAAVSPFSLPHMNAASPQSIYNSANYSNGIFVVEAYFLNCPYCNENAENVNNLTTHYANDPRVQVLDVGIDKKDSQYATWIKKHNPNHPVLKDANRVLIRQLGTSGYPSTYVLDCRGNIAFETSGVWEEADLAGIKGAVDKLLSLDCFQE